MKRYSKEQWFVPLDNQIYQNEVAEKIVVAENEDGEQLAINQESSISNEYISNEFFNIFKKKNENTKERPIPDEVWDYIYKHYNARQPETLEKEAKRLEDMGLLSGGGMSDTDINIVKRCVNFSIPNDVIVFLKKYGKITSPIVVPPLEEMISKQWVLDRIEQAENYNRNEYQKALKFIDSLGEFITLVDLNDPDCLIDLLLLTKKGIINITINEDYYFYTSDKYKSELGKDYKYTPNIIFFELLDKFDFEANYYLDRYRKGKWDIPTSSNEGIEESIDTPLIIKDKKSDSQEMTADDLTNDKQEAEKVKEEFDNGDNPDDDSIVTDGDNGSNDSDNSTDTDSDTASDNTTEDENTEDDSDTKEEDESEENNDSKEESLESHRFKDYIKF